MSLSQIEWVSDLYPTKYPSGRCVINRGDEYLLYDYTYKDGKVTLDGDPMPVEDYYRPKKDINSEKRLESIEGYLMEIKEGRVLSSTNRKLVKNIIDGLDELRDNLSKLYDATEPPIRESASEEITVEGDFETTKSQPQLELPDNLEEIISEAVEKSLTPERIGKVLREKVKDEIDRLRGVVR